MTTMDGVSFIVSRGHAHARAYFCFPVEECTRMRSPVIDTLREFGGIVELPEGVELAELQAWAALQPSQAPEMSPEQLCTALKVDLCSQTEDLRAAKFVHFSSP